MINCSRLRELLSNYDPNAYEDDVVKSDEQRAELVAGFPKEDWPAMTLERYALGQPDQPDNFCRWMEFVATAIGSIRGGSARKHLIYFQASTGEWWFDQKLYSNVQRAWEAVRSGFVRAIELAEAGGWDQVDQIPSLRGAPALVNKTLAVYFSNDLLPINSETHLRHFLRELGDQGADDQTSRTVGLNRLLLDGIRACGTLEGWSTKEMERLLYSSDLDLFIAQLPSSPIKDVSGFIEQLLTDWGDERLEARRENEDQARRLLDEFAGEMNEDHARALFSLFNADRMAYSSSEQQYQ